MGPDAMILVFWMLSFKQLLSTLKEPCSAQEAILRAWSTVSNINPYKFRLRGYIGTDRSFHSGSDGKESACKVGDLGLIPGLGISRGEGNGYPLQYFCLENSMDRIAWEAVVHGVTELDMTERLTHTHTYTHTQAQMPGSSNRKRFGFE